MEVVYVKTITEQMLENVESAHNLGKTIEKFVLDENEFEEFLASDYYNREYWIGAKGHNDLHYLEIPVIKA